MNRYGSLTARTAREAAEWSTGRVIRANLRAVVGRAYPRVIGLTLEPSWIFFEILLPFLAVSAFVFVYRALGAAEEFVGFVVLGGAMTAFWLNVVWMMAAQFYWEKDQGNLELYFTAPMHLMSILAGMAIGGLVMTSSRALAVIGIGSVLYGVTYQVEQPLLLALVFLLTMIPLYVTILAIFAHRQQGPAAAAHVFRGLLYGMFAFAGFFITLSLLLEKGSIAISFVLAIVVALAIQGITLWILRQKHA